MRIIIYMCSVAGPCFQDSRRTRCHHPRSSFGPADQQENYINQILSWNQLIIITFPVKTPPIMILILWKEIFVVSVRSPVKEEPPSSGTGTRSPMLATSSSGFGSLSSSKSSSSLLLSNHKKDYHWKTVSDMGEMEGGELEIIKKEKYAGVSHCVR